MMEKTKERDFFIITFTLDDYEKMLEGVNFFELVKAKKLEMQLAANYTTFLKDNKHEAEEQIISILNGCVDN